MSRPSLPLVAGVVLTGLVPLASLLAGEGQVLGDPLGEVPVKLWLVETFAEVGLFGGAVDSIAFPRGGVLNNPDPLGTLVTALLRPVVGRAAAWNLLLAAQLVANAAAVAWLVRRRVGDDAAALTAAVAFALTPLALVYCVAGAITDVLHLWPWPLAIGCFLGAVEGRWHLGLWAGLWAGLGVVASPYNGVVFAALAPPGLVWLGVALARQRLAPRAVLRAAGATMVRRRAHRRGFAAWTAALMAAPDSQMSLDAVGATRHVAPFHDLRPGVADRYTAFLADWVAVGKGALVEREQAARFFRAFSPGLVVLGLAMVGLWRSRSLLWGLGAVFCVLASTGPFLPLNGALSFDAGGQPRLAAPPPRPARGGPPPRALPLRLPAVLCLAVLAGHGAVALGEGRGSCPWSSSPSWSWSRPCPCPSRPRRPRHRRSTPTSTCPRGPSSSCPTSRATATASSATTSCTSAATAAPFPTRSWASRRPGWSTTPSPPSSSPWSARPAPWP